MSDDARHEEERRTSADAGHVADTSRVVVTNHDVDAGSIVGARDVVSARVNTSRRRLVSFVVVLSLALGFLVTLKVSARRASVATAATKVASEVTSAPSAAQDASLDYSKFLHTSPRHASLDCASCHRRAADNSPRPSFPGHKACTDCHLAQFVTPNVPMCAICHRDVSRADAPLKNFPERFDERFNVKFDHAQHMNGAARPERGCVACHSQPLRRGVALSIPAGLGAHNNCYTCHTPNSRSDAGRDLASCGVCHTQASYARTSTNARAFRVGFSHADHGARQRLSCADCHTVTPGLAQSRQVSAPRAAQHFNTTRAQSCMSCHNGRRAFGDTDFGDCKRCHEGQTFRTGL